MPRLFWKLFLSFWIALLMFSGGLLLATSYYLDKAKEDADLNRSTGGFNQRQAEAQAAANKDGLKGLTAWARQLDTIEVVPVLVLERDGHDLLHREPSLQAQAHFLRHVHGEDRYPDSRKVQIHQEDRDRDFWIIADFEGVTLSRLISRPGVVGTQLLLATLIGAAVSLFLASYLTAPLKRMQRAALAYGQGSFRMKVTPTLGGRRDEIVDLAITMDQMGEHIDVLLQARHKLLRDVSHELRSPLARIQAAIGLMRQRGNDADTALGLDRIDKESERMDELIARLMTISRLEAGIQTLRPEPLSLGRLVVDVVDSANIEARAKNCRVFCRIDDAGLYQGDPSLLASAIDNVLRNAIRYAPESSEIRVSLQRDSAIPEEYLLEISDTGFGVPETMLETIFEPFVRVDDSRNPGSGGTGLGLAIARKAIEAHGGSIVAQNKPEGGLRVLMRFR